MFTGEDFQSQFPSGATNKQETKELKRLYSMDDDEQQSAPPDPTDETTVEPATIPKFEDAMDEDERFAIDYSRGEVLLESSDDDDDDDAFDDTAEDDNMLVGLCAF